MGPTHVIRQWLFLITKDSLACQQTASDEAKAKQVDDVLTCRPRCHRIWRITYNCLANNTIYPP